MFTTPHRPGGTVAFVVALSFGLVLVIVALRVALFVVVFLIQLLLFFQSPKATLLQARRVGLQ